MQATTPDAIILAGGLGTRLRGIWDAPKCLVTVAGKPILLHLLETLAEVNTRRVVLALGHKATAVLNWKKKNHNLLPHSLSITHTIEDRPLGTEKALQYALSQTSKKQHHPLYAPLIVLNGDTLRPRRSLIELLETYRDNNDRSVFSLTPDFVHAGAAALSKDGVALIKRGGALTDIPMLFHIVESFLDIGTPESFARAQKLETYP